MNLKTMLLLLASALCVTSCVSDKAEDEPQSKRQINYKEAMIETYAYDAISAFKISVPDNGTDYFIINSQADINRLTENDLPKKVRDICEAVPYNRSSVVLVRRFISETLRYQSIENTYIYKIGDNKIQIDIFCYNQTPVTPDTDIETTVIEFHPYEIPKISEETEIEIIEIYKD